LCQDALAIVTDDARLNSDICQNGSIKGLAKTVLPACERTVELASVTSDPYLYYEVCQSRSIDGLTRVALLACGRAVALAVATDDIYLCYEICLNKHTGGLAQIALPACRRVEELSTDISFGEPVTGTIEVGGRSLWIFKGMAGQVVTITMTGDDYGVDPYLTLLGPDGTVLVEDDDGGDGKNSMIRGFSLPETGVYAIIARGYSLNSAGVYRLTLVDDTD